MRLPFILSLALSFSASAREWKDRLGRPFEAELVRIHGSNVILSMPNGRVVSVAIAELSAADQMSLTAPQPAARQTIGRVPAAVPQAAPSLNFGAPWPRDVRLQGGSSCKVVSESAKTTCFIYESPGYRFTSDSRIIDDALRNFSVMFETTRMYAKALPLGMGGGNGRGGKMDILLFGEMNDYIRAGGMPGSIGCYVPSKGYVMVPMEVLGLKRGGTGFGIDTRRNSTVLIHELAHQLTPPAYLRAPARGWFSEGLAEYFAATPYSWGYFAPDPHGNATMEYVTTAGRAEGSGRGLGKTIRCPGLRDFFLMDYGTFSGANGNLNYGVGLLVTHYFLHMEGGGRASRITQFLKGLHQGATGEAALSPLLGGGSYDKLESEIAAAWAKKGILLQFGT